MPKELTGFDLTNLKHLAVVRLSALGDVILLLPTIRTLQKILPNLKITWITTKLPYQILAGIENIEFIVIDKPKSVADYFRLQQRLKHHKFDIVLALQANFRANLIYPLLKAPIKLGYDKQRAKDAQSLFITHRIPFAKQHLLDSFFAFIEALGIHERVLEWRLAISEEDYQWAKLHLPKTSAPLLAINPLASKPERNWLTTRYVEVMQRARAEWQAEIILTGGPTPAEKEMGNTLEKAAPFPITNLIGKSTPKQLAAVLASVKCLLAPDTGPVHIATAMGTPVVGLYAVAPPELSAPYLSKDLTVNCYPQALREILQLNPDTVKWGTRVHDQRAMELISVDAVMTQLRKVFNSSYILPQSH